MICPSTSMNSKSKFVCQPSVVSLTTTSQPSNRKPARRTPSTSATTQWTIWGKSLSSKMSIKSPRSSSTKTKPCSITSSPTPETILRTYITTRAGPTILAMPITQFKTLSSVHQTGQSLPHNSLLLYSWATPLGVKVPILNRTTAMCLKTSHSMTRLSRKMKYWTRLKDVALKSDNYPNTCTPPFQDNKIHLRKSSLIRTFRNCKPTCPNGCLALGVWSAKNWKRKMTPATKSLTTIRKVRMVSSMLSPVSSVQQALSLSKPILL